MNSSTGQAPTWRARFPVYYGWLILGMVFLATFGATGTTQVVMGGIQIFITDDTGWDRATLSIAVTSGSWLGGFFSPFLGRITDRYGPRWLMAGGLIVSGIAFLLLGEVRLFWQFFGAYLIGRAVGNPTLIGVVPQTAVVNFFRRRRNIALGLMSTFRPIGGAITIQIISFIAIHQGWRSAYRYFGIFGFLLVLPLIVIMRRRPEDIGLLPDGASPEGPADETSIAPASGRGTDEEFSWTAREAFGTKAFWLLGVTSVLGSWAASATGYSLVPYLHDEVGLSKTQAVGVLSFGTFLSLSNLGWAYLADRITPRRCLVICLAVSGLMMLVLMMVNSLATALVFALIWGVFSGSGGSLDHMVLAQYFGRRSYGTITGALQPFTTFTLGMGPAAASIFVAAVGNASILYFAIFGVHLASALFVFLAHQPARPVRDARQVIPEV